MRGLQTRAWFLLCRHTPRRTLVASKKRHRRTLASPHPVALTCFACSDQTFSQGLERVQLHLQDTCQEDGGGGACLICLCHISPSEAVWHCEDSCYTMMHLTCIQVRRSAPPERAVASPMGV